MTLKADNPRLSTEFFKKSALTNEDIKITINPVSINDPILVRSFEVVYPYRLSPPKKAAAVKKALTILSPVYVATIGEMEAPTSTEYNQNKD
jgi:hypothetical protein